MAEFKPDKMNLRDLDNISYAEILFTDRRRREQTQNERAAGLEISRHRYSRWERGLDKTTLAPVAQKVWQRMKDKGAALKDHEVALLYRRRAKMTQRALARELGFCPRTINCMERGETSAERLLEYWER